MTKPRFGDSRLSTYSRGQQVQALPERKIVTFRDFRRGYTPSEQRQMVDPAASPVTFNVEVRRDNGIQKVPGTKLIEPFFRNPSELALHPTLNELVDLVLVAAPEVGFRHPNGDTDWYNLGFALSGEFAYTTFGGTFFFTDGVRVWYKLSPAEAPVALPGAPVARDYASFAGRVFGFGAVIEGQFEPLGARWSAANSDFRDWSGFGSGFELLINDVSAGDKILAGIPMGLDLIAVMMRQSIWLGRFTGNALRPADFSVRVSGVGAINKRVCVLTRFGVIFLSDNGVYIFDGNEATLISKDINADLIPIDYENLDAYHATYDPMRKRYVLFTPDRVWTFEVEHQRWLYRTFSSLSAVMYPTQIDGIRWFEAIGQWNEQSELIWLDFAPRNLGELTLYMLGEQLDETAVVRRVLSEESYESECFFGEPFAGYWETKLADEQNATMLVTSMEQVVEYRGGGCLRLWLPDEDNIYEPVVQTLLAERDYPSTAVFNAQKVGKGTGIGIEFCAAECETFEPPPEPEIEVAWTGFMFFSDVHSSTPVEDSQQVGGPLEIACYQDCDEEVCGGPGGWLVWYSNNPEELEQGCAHPNNPIPGLIAGSS
jgi:hypothetical protein